MKTYLNRSLSIFGVLVVSVGAMFILASFKAPPKRKPPTDDRPLITTMEIQNSEIALDIPVIGRLTAHDRVKLFAEVSGKMQPGDKPFEIGQEFKAGEVMFQIDRLETELNLKAQRSNLMTGVAALLPELKFDYPESYRDWNNYLEAFDLESETEALPEIRNEREKIFVANKGIYTNYYSIKSAEARLNKYTVRAPFDGVVIDNNIKPGNLVMNGQSLGVFISTDLYDLETTIGLADIGFVQQGDQVRLYSDQIAGEWTGVVSRVNQSLNGQTQRVDVTIAVTGEGLKEQMFLEGEIQSSLLVSGVQIPRKLLQDGNQVLEVVDGSLRSRPVQVISASGEEALVQGLADGSLISTQIQGLYDGVAVKVIPVETQGS